MKDRAVVLMGALAVVLAVASLASVRISGQTGAASSAVAKTPWGEPDLQGIWDTRTRAPLERPKEFGTKEFMTEEEARDRMARKLDAAVGDDEEAGESLAQADVNRAAQADKTDDGRPGYRIAGAEYNAFWFADAAKIEISLRTSQVVDPPDGRMPPLTREALAIWEAREKARMGRSQGDDWEDRGTSERCLVRNGLPSEMIGYSQFPTLEVVQSPGYVSIVLPTGYVRIIPTDGRSHAAAAIRQWFGDSRGRWDGNTLVVETTNFKNQVKNVIPGHGGPFGGTVRNHVHYYPGSGDRMRLTERFTASGATLDYRYTLDDPDVFVSPWTAVVTWHRDATPQDRIFEYACHEHNYGMANAIAGAQADRAWALDEAKRDQALRLKDLGDKKEQLRQWEASHGQR